MIDDVCDGHLLIERYALDISALIKGEDRPIGMEIRRHGVLLPHCLPSLRS